jgi:hypothetical protein
MKQYIPLGTRVVLKILPVTEGAVVIPDGLGNTVKTQFFSVYAVGPKASDADFPINVGDVVLICAHPSLLTGVSKEEQLCCVNREDIAVIVREGTEGQN